MQHLTRNLALAILSVCFTAVAADAHAKKGRSSSSSLKPSSSTPSKKHEDEARKKKDDEAKEQEAKTRRDRDDRGIRVDLGDRSRSQVRQQTQPAQNAPVTNPLVNASAVVAAPAAAAPSPEDLKRKEELAALQKRFEQETAARRAEADAKRAQDEARQAAAAEAERKQREQKLLVAQREAEKKRHQEELQRQCVIKPVMTDTDIARCRTAWSNS